MKIKHTCQVCKKKWEEFNVKAREGFIKKNKPCYVKGKIVCIGCFEVLKHDEKIKRSYIHKYGERKGLEELRKIKNEEEKRKRESERKHKEILKLIG